VIVHVAVPVPGLALLTYSVPERLTRPAVGARVVVPLGSRVVTGIVMDDASASSVADAAVKPIRDVLDADAFVPPEVVDLARWTAEYYAAGPGDTITSVLPPKARGARADSHKTMRVASITAVGLEALQPVAPKPEAKAERALITAKQREALHLLWASPDGIPTAQLAGRGIAPDVVARLVRHGFVSIRQDRLDRDPFRTAAVESVADPGRRLTTEQAAAFSRLSAMALSCRFQVALLHGVTGSGKTELYVRLAAAVRESGRRALMLVPEIALTPVVASVFRHAFGERVAIQHSGLSDGERHDQWQRIRRGDVDVVVGTRSAVFAPLERVGLIVVDEEHDASYKQEESPRYHGRDVAIIRGQRAGALVVLGSATPSMESYYNATTGRYERVVLEKRVLDRPLATVAVVDMREEYAERGPDVVLSRALGAAIAARLERREQALVLLNRRGFATAVFCRQCAGTMDCPNCSVSLVVHGEGAARRARCHYCNFTMRVPSACPHCAGPYLEQAGFGTERVEAEVRRLCPQARIARLDRDAIRRKGALTEILSRFRAGDIDVLVGTQMIAKGHDFPRVTLVGVVSADVGLGLADFRASERTFQLLTQVVGRAGRGDEPGEAIVQTIYPDHYSIQLARRQDYRAFFERELTFRQQMRYPPFQSLVNTVVRSRTFAGAMDDAADVVRRMREGADAAGVRVLGPAPAPLGKLRGEYRAQLLAKGSNRTRMRGLLMAAIAARPDLDKRIVVDVDPVSVL
jgi:primosomal protein N' (replication factor Y) (superfamily II helicase)